jgi:flagellar biosynthesis/type III secretory pathway protein FliH
VFNFSERSGKERSGKRDLVKKKCYFICSNKRSGAEEGRKEGRKAGRKEGRNSNKVE